MFEEQLEDLRRVRAGLSSMIRRKREQFRAVREEPWSTFWAGAAAGLVGRSAVLPLDRGSTGAYHAVSARALQKAVLLSVYVPLAKYNYSTAGDDPLERLKATFFTGFAGGVTMRLMTNPLGRLRDEGHGLREPRALTFLRFVTRGEGWVGLWRHRHPVFNAGLHTGTVFVGMQGSRNYLVDKVGLTEESSVFKHALVNGAAGFAGSVFAAFVVWPWSNWRYLGLRRESLVTWGPPYVAFKDAPLTAVTLFTFTMLMNYSAEGRVRHGKHSGFGY